MGSPESLRIYEVIITPYAEQLLNSYIDYIQYTLLNEQAAKKRQYNWRKSLLLSRYLALFRHVANAAHRDAAYAESR